MQDQSTAQTFDISPENKGIPPTIVYPSWTMKYALASLVNLLILLVGIALGLLLRPYIDRPVHAASEPQFGSQLGTSQVPFGQTVVAAVEPKITSVSPSLTTGTVGIYLVLSHHIQSDELVVNGYDLLKLQNEELGLLSRFVSSADIQNAVNRSRAAEVYKIEQPKPAQAPATTKPQP